MSSLRKLLLTLAAVLALAGLSHVPLSAAKPGSGTPKLSLTVSPSTITEGATATGTVTHNSSNTSSAVTVTLGSSDTSEATVPASVTIPAGTNSATFTVTAVNDGTSDGDQTATLSASAGGYTSASAAVTISDKIPFQYRTEVIPTGANNSLWINGITNNSRVYGWVAQIVDSITTYKSGFMYDQVSQTMYDLNQIPVLTAQVRMLAGPDFSFSSITGMNESGLVTGSLKDSSGTFLGFAIDTTVDGQFSPDPANWEIALLPGFGSTYTFGWRINASGDILGQFQRADGTSGIYVYNPWVGGAPAVPNVNAQPGGLNDFALVAGVDDMNRAFLYDATTDSIEYFAETQYFDIGGLNNSGVFAGSANVTVPATRGNKSTTSRTSFRHDGTLQPIAGSWRTAEGTCLNEAGDVAYYDSTLSRKSMLSHTGFAPDYTEQQFLLTKVIANDDPLKATLVDVNPSVDAINDRDATGYPQLVVVYSSDSIRANRAVILTPYLVP